MNREQLQAALNAAVARLNDGLVAKARAIADQLAREALDDMAECMRAGNAVEAQAAVESLDWLAGKLDLIMTAIAAGDWAALGELAQELAREEDEGEEEEDGTEQDAASPHPNPLPAGEGSRET